MAWNVAASQAPNLPSRKRPISKRVDCGGLRGRWEPVVLDVWLDQIRECVSTVKEHQRQRGRYLGGRVPFGYRVENSGLVEVREPDDKTGLGASMRNDVATLATIQQANGRAWLRFHL